MLSYLLNPSLSFINPRFDYLFLSLGIWDKWQILHAMVVCPLIDTSWDFILEILDEREKGNNKKETKIATKSS